MPRVEIKGTSIFYTGELAGDRPVLLFLHGAGGSHRHWLYQVTGLKPGAAALAPDLPGHALSGGEPAAEIAAYREFLRAFCSALGLENFFLAGHSMGGAIALDYALHYGGSLRGLILAGSGARLRVAPPLLEACRAGEMPPGLIEFAYGPAAAADLLTKARREMETVPPQTYYADFTACNGFDCTAQLEEVNLPVLLICGEADRLTPFKYSRFLAEKLPQAQLVEVKGAGHMVMLEAPRQVNRAIASFVEKCGGS